MKTIYSILYVTLNTALDEKISIGLLMSKSDGVFFKYSSDKLLGIKGIIDSERYNFVRSYLKSLEKNICSAINDINKFDDKITDTKWISESYISYLSKYSNNLVQFSGPKIIDIIFNEENFKKIYEKYIYALDLKSENRTSDSIFEKVKLQLYPKIDNRVNLDISLNSTHFENLFAPIEVNFIGINGIPVAGQTIDFEKKHYNLENDITRFVSLTKAIELQSKNSGQYYVLGREPENKNEKNHILWEQIRESGFLNFVDIDELGIVENYMEKNDVKPYFSK